MAKKKASKKTKSSAPDWAIVFEEMKSQNRATIEAVESIRVGLEERIERMDNDSRQRDAVLEMVLRDLRLTVQENSTDIRALQGDVRGLSDRVERLARIEERVAALEKRLA
jgi:hypothetical protein